jgi:hypothetical protein
MPDLLTEFDILVKISDNEFFINFDSKIVSDYYSFQATLNDILLKKIEKIQKVL